MVNGSDARPVRFPLQTGESALWNAGVGTAVALLGLFFLRFLNPRLALSGGVVVAVVIATTGIFVLGAGLGRVRRGYLERASDIVLSREGISLVGGHHDGKTFQWTEIDPARCELYADSEDVRSATGKASGPPMHKLLLALRGLDMLELAEARELAERRSLEAVLDALRSSHWYGGQESGAARASEGRWRSLGLAVITCPSCGAASAPSTEAKTRCRFCNGEVPMPEDMRARLAAAASLGDAHTRVEQTVLRLLEQPGPRFTGGLLVASAAYGLLCLPVIWVAMPLPPFVLAASFLPTLHLAAHGATIDRRALRMLSLEGGAQAPTLPGEPYLCRVCDAPLPEVDSNRIVVSCSYCAAPNVLGVDLRREVPRTRDEAGALESILDARKSSRRLRALGLGAATLLTLFGAWMLFAYPR